MLRWCDIMVNPTTIQRLSTPWLTVAVFTINHNQQSTKSVLSIVIAYFAQPDPPYGGIHASGPKA